MIYHINKLLEPPPRYGLASLLICNIKEEQIMTVKIMYHQNEDMQTSFVENKLYQDFLIILLRCGYSVDSVAIMEESDLPL